jgi:hypothetical protein
MKVNSYRKNLLRKYYLSGIISKLEIIILTKQKIIFSLENKN